MNLKELSASTLYDAFVLKIRAANLSGDCFFAKENFGRFRFGWSKHQQVNKCDHIVHYI